MSGRRLLRALTRCLEELLAPGICVGCGCPCNDRSSLCGSCATRLETVPEPCEHCGQPSPLGNPVCPACRLDPPRWQRLVAPLHYRGAVRDYLLELKHAQATYLARALCAHTSSRFRQHWPRPEVLLPVPLHRDRLLQRGFNQALEIARLWSAELDIPVDANALTRRLATPLQAGLSASQRAGNVRYAFVYAPRRCYRHVAVIDDIVTTGSTATEIARVLQRDGVDFVEIWALARTCRI